MSGSVWYISFSNKKIEFKKYPKKKKFKKIVKKQKKNYKKILANLLLIFSLVIFLGVISSAQINDTLHINLQTTYSNGTIQSGTFTFAFNITENSSSSCSGPIVYNHSVSETTDTRGIVSIYLPTNGSGGGNLSELDFDKQYYLCYYRDGTLKDVSQLGRVPYSFRATQVNLSEITVDSNLSMTDFNVTASWFKGIYDWIINASSQSYLNFNGTHLDFNETQLNTTIDSKISSGSVNNSDFLDGYNSSFFMPLNTSVYGDFDFNGGWTGGGFSISGGDIYAQVLYVYNITSLTISNLKINGSLFPQEGYDNTFDIGSSILRWRDLYLGGEISSNGTGDNYFLGNVGIGTASPQQKLHVNGSAVINGTLNLDSNQINNLANGTSAQDAVTLSQLQIVNGSATASETDPHWTGNYSNVAFTNIDELFDENLSVMKNFSVDTNTLFVDSTNNKVGIGTTSPDQLLDIDDGGGISGNPLIEFNDRAWFGYNGSLSGAYIKAGSAKNIVFATNGSNERMRIDSSGNVGIGTTSPSDNLDILGDTAKVRINATNGTISNPAGLRFVFKWSNGDTGQFNIAVRGNHSTPEYTDKIDFAVYNGSSWLEDLMRLHKTGDVTFESGSVGIGTSSPAAKLEIDAGGGGASSILIANYDKLQFKGSSGTGAEIFSYTDDNFFIDNEKSADIILRTSASSEVMRLQDGGNVGIGTDSPASLLDVSGINPKITISNETDSGNQYCNLVYYSSYGFGELECYGSQGNLDLQGAAEGDLRLFRRAGSGENPYVYIYGYDTGASTQKYGFMIVDSTGDFNIGAQSGEVMRFYTGGSSRVTIDNSGQVGVGTDTPKNTMNVAGTFNATGDWYSAGTTIVTGNSLEADSLTQNDVDSSEIAADAVSDSELDGGFGWTLDTDLNIDSNTLVVSYDDDRVGIGTASPSEELEVTGDIQLSGGADRTIYVGSEGVGDAAGKDLTVRGGTGYGGFSTGGDLNLSGGIGVIGGNVYITGYDGQSGAGNVIIAESVGYVGIGTSSPDQELDIVGEAIIHPDETWSSGDTVSMYFGDTSSRINNTWGVGFEIRAGDDFIFTKPDNSGDYFHWKNSGGTTLMTLGNSGDLNIVGELEGSRQSFPFGESSSHAPSSSFYLKTINGVTSSATKGYIMHRAGSIVGVSFEATISDAIGGNALIEVRKGGSAVYSETLSITGNGELSTYGTQARGTDTFSAGDVIAIYYNYNTADCTVDEIVAYVEVVYDN